MKKRRIFAVVFAALLLSGCGEFTVSERNQIEEVDGMVYAFIVGKVEGNDDLLAEVLTEKAQGILQPGRHAYPGAAEEMGERYNITRYTNRFQEGVIFYVVDFYRPSTGKQNFYNVAVVNTSVGWRIAKNSSLEESQIAEAVLMEEGTVVHEYEGGE